MLSHHLPPLSLGPCGACLETGHCRHCIPQPGAPRPGQPVCLFLVTGRVPVEQLVLPSPASRAQALRGAGRAGLLPYPGHTQLSTARGAAGARVVSAVSRALGFSANRLWGSSASVVSGSVPEACPPAPSPRLPPASTPACGRGGAASAPQVARSLRCLSGLLSALLPCCSGVCPRGELVRSLLLALVHSLALCLFSHFLSPAPEHRL